MKILLSTSPSLDNIINYKIIDLKVILPSEEIAYSKKINTEINNFFRNNGDPELSFGKVVFVSLGKKKTIIWEHNFNAGIIYIL